MSSNHPTVTRAPEIALDATTFVLFAVFVTFLYVGYLGRYPGVPFPALGAVALLGALAILFVANWMADRRLPEPDLATLP